MQVQNGLALQEGPAFKIGTEALFESKSYSVSDTYLELIIGICVRPRFLLPRGRPVRRRKELGADNSS